MTQSDEPVGIFAAQRRVMTIAAGVVALFGVMSSIYDSLRGDSPAALPPAESTHRAPPERVALRLPAMGAAQGSVAGPVAAPVAGPVVAPPPPAAAPPAAGPRAGFEQWIPGPALSMIDDFSRYWGG